MVDASADVGVPALSRSVVHPWQCLAGAVIYRFAASIAFWGLSHGPLKTAGHVPSLILISVVPTLMTLLGLRLVSPWGKRIGPLQALLGIWVTAPFFFALASQFSESGPNIHVFLGFFIFGTVFFPIATFMFSTYDATLGALMLTTIALLIQGRKNLPLVRNLVRFLRHWPHVSGE